MVQAVVQRSANDKLGPKDNCLHNGRLREMPVIPRSSTGVRGARPSQRGTARSEAVLLDLLDHHLLHALDVVDLLALQVVPQILQGRSALGVGDVLVVAPYGVEPLAQVVDQVMVVVCSTTSLADVLQFFFRRQCHDAPPLRTVKIKSPLAAAIRLFCQTRYWFVSEQQRCQQEEQKKTRFLSLIFCRARNNP